ncbi:DNA-3-methyladenine glycosylase I [Marinicella meishanensis]|uniref:DNA-3-methyladenine glycosylase I n=1 Tax=Marinicella meishanensis TaxID=2873263 RepID=UPI001CC078A2|nr:DNA-3-methyladenine glycosylase I [Marinicella sp. NBU2979]
MKPFAEIHAMAAARKGGDAVLQSLLPKVPSAKQLAQKGDDRFLAMMCKAINQAGFNWTVIENKWPQFEEAFHGFDVQRLAFKPPEAWEAYVQDTRVVRNWSKIKALMENASFVHFTAQEHGSFARFIAEWPCSDQIGLMAYLKKHGSRLGGNTGFWFLRYVGKDCFTTTHDTIQAVKWAGYETHDHPTSKRDLTQVQLAFNTWHEETNLPYTHLSRIAAYSSGENYPVAGIKEQMSKFKAGSA